MRYEDAKEALDKIIRKSRVHLYKPIQISEILYRDRAHHDIDPSRLETYRNPSKAWRDNVSKRLLGRVCTSSQKFQDNLFEGNAIPPNYIVELAAKNRATKGSIEKYIYDSFRDRQDMVAMQLAMLHRARADTFDVKKFVRGFTASPGLRRSVDKAYEIVVYAIFDTIVRGIGATVSISSSKANFAIMLEFEDFTRLVLGIDTKHPTREVPAKLYRVGVTNAADRGLDMWANFGPAIQVKHLTFSREMAEDISSCISADEIIIVCEQGEAKSIQIILTQLGLGDRVRGVVTLEDLGRWYDRCLRGKHAQELSDILLKNLTREFSFEFPSTGELVGFCRERGYDKM
jgi:type II restriction enzyme